MSRLEELESQIKTLSWSEFQELRAWLAEHDAEIWDRQFHADVHAGKLEAIVDATEAYLMDAPERERTTSEIGELIMENLKTLDTVAYIRFASVYRDFKDVREFREELEQLFETREPNRESARRK